MHPNSICIRIRGMNDEFAPLFSHLKTAEPNADLGNRIVKIIKLRQARSKKIRIALSSAFATISIFAVVPAISYFTTELLQTGFGNYLSIIFSDGYSVMAYWKDFTLLLADSFPVTGSLLVLTTSLLLLSSLKLLISEIVPTNTLKVKTI